MTPNFALSLAFDGIRLLHRVPGGWHLVGEVPIDAPNLAQELSVLRRTALSLDPKGLRTKILIPNDQIKYMALDGTRASEDDIHHALHGATPYALTELVVDHSRGGGRTYIAAVPKETLAEAEAFAVENKFSPICFAAVPEPFTYQGEVFFGRTKAADTLLATDEKVGRDLDPVKIIGAVHLPKPDPVVAPTPAEPAAPTPEPEAPAPAPEPEPVAAIVAPTEAADTAGASGKPADPAELVQDDMDEKTDDAGADSLPAADDGAPVQTSDESLFIADEAALQTANPDNPAPAEDIPVAAEPVSGREAPEAEAEDPAPDHPKTEPEVVFASRARPLRADDDVAPPSVRPAPAAPVRQSGGDVSFSSRHRNGKGESPPARKDPPVLAVPKDAGTATPVAPPLSRDEAAPSASLPPITTAAPVATEAPPVTGRAADALPETLVNLGALNGPAAFAPGTIAAAPTARTPILATPDASAAKPAPAPIAKTLTPEPANPKSGGLFRSRRKEGKRPALAEATPAEEEASRLTIFGARKPAKTAAVGGKPRFLLLILMLVLLLAMAAVAVLASRTEGGLAALLGIDRTGAATTEMANTPASDLVVPVAVPDPDMAADAAAPDQTAQTDPPDATAAAPPGATADQAMISAMAAALAAAADQTGLAQQGTPASQPTVDAAASEAGAALLSPAEAQRLYEATGVWQRAARLPIIPRTEAAPAVVLAAIDEQAKATLPLPSLPDAGATAPDPALAPQIAPPGPDVVFERDERGFIKATPEGTVMPDGLVVYAGAPSVRAAPRPGSAPAAPQVDLTTEDPAAPLDPTSSVIAEAAATEAAPSAVGEVLAALVDGPRPRPRPDTLAPVVEEAAPEATADPALGRIRPQLRPAGLAPDVAASEPEPVPEPDPAPGEAAAAAAAAASTVDVAAIADAIAASAPPDPTAGATRLAPAASGRPDIRPRNFDRVVAAARRTPAPAAPEAPAQPATEPAVARNATVAPSGPVPGGVARAATEENAINLRQLALLGVRGSSGDRVAIVRQPNGRILSVRVGDRLDGGQITAIGEHALNYVKRGRTYTLEIGA